MSQKQEIAQEILDNLGCFDAKSAFFLRRFAENLRAVNLEPAKKAEVKKVVLEEVHIINPLTLQVETYRQSPPSNYCGIPDKVHLVSNSTLNAIADKKKKEVMDGEIVCDFEIHRRVDKKWMYRPWRNCISSGFRLMEPSGVRMYDGWKLLKIQAIKDLTKFKNPTPSKKENYCRPTSKVELTMMQKLAEFNQKHHRK